LATSRLDSAFAKLRRIVLIRDGAGLTDAREEKTAMAELGNPQCTDGERGRPKNGFFKTSSGVAVQGAWHSLPLYARRLAILVHQRKDPTLPYQALASRESVRLFLRVCPLGTLDVLATRIWCS